MAVRSLLTPRQFGLLLAYSLVFPLTNLVGGAVAFMGLVVTLPFLPLAWVGGLALVSVAGEASYLVGAAITVFLQVLGLATMWSLWARRRRAKART
jgi:hypothetical protein